MPNATVRAAAIGLPALSFPTAPAVRTDLRAFVPDGAFPKKSDFDPNDFPEEYAMLCSGDCLSPHIPDGTKVLVSSLERPHAGDFAAIYKRPEIVADGEFQCIMKRLATNVPEWAWPPFRAHPNSEVVPIFFAEMFNPPRMLKIPCHALIAIHKVVGTIPNDLPTYKPGDAELVKIGRAQRAKRQVLEARA